MLLSSPLDTVIKEALTQYFQLQKYVDYETCFASQKSTPHGRNRDANTELKLDSHTFPSSLKTIDKQACLNFYLSHLDLLQSVSNIQFMSHVNKVIVTSMPEVGKRNNW